MELLFYPLIGSRVCLYRIIQVFQITETRVPTAWHEFPSTRTCIFRFTLWQLHILADERHCWGTNITTTSKEPVWLHRAWFAHCISRFPMVFPQVSLRWILCKCTAVTQESTQAACLPASHCTQFDSRPDCLQLSDGKTNKNYWHYYFQHVMKSILAENYQQYILQLLHWSD